MLQWLRLYTLGSRGSRELETFLEIRLIFHESIKSWRTRRENTLLFKENFARKPWPIDAVVGADWRRCRIDFLGINRGFNPATNQPRFGGELAAIVGRSGHDRTAIMSHDRGSNSIAALWSDQVGWAVPIVRSSPSFIYRPVEIHRPMKRPPSDGDLTLHASPRREEDHASPWPSDRDRTAFIWWRSGTSRDTTCPKVSPLISFTYSIFPRRAPLMIAWTWVHAIIVVLTEFDDCAAAT